MYRSGFGLQGYRLVTQVSRPVFFKKSGKDVSNAFPVVQVCIRIETAQLAGKIRQRSDRQWYGNNFAKNGALHFFKVKAGSPTLAASAPGRNRPAFKNRKWEPGSHNSFPITPRIPSPTPVNHSFVEN